MNTHTPYPDLIQQLPRFDGPFDAHRLSAENCDVLFASYPAGTRVDEHTHSTENVGVITQGVLLLTMDGITESFGVGQWYHVPAGKPHTAEFPEATSEIEFWFTQSG